MKSKLMVMIEEKVQEKTVINKYLRLAMPKVMERYLGKIVTQLAFLLGFCCYYIIEN